MKRFLLKWAALCAVCLFTLGASAQDDTPDYLCFTANTNDSSVKLIKNGSPTEVSLEYSYDGSHWRGYQMGDEIFLSSSMESDFHKVYFRNTSDTPTGFSTDTDYYQFVMEGSIAASGNVMSLLDKTCELTDIKQTKYRYCFYQLFSGCEALTTAPKLPATVLSQNCYNQMFQGCTNLTAAPELPAAAQTSRCYYQMFKDCSKLNVVKVGLTIASWSTTITSNWLSGVATKGFFICPDELVGIITSRSTSKVPENWYINEYPLTVPATGWASMYLPIEVTIPEGVKAYYASAASGTVITLKPIETSTIPANTAVIVTKAGGGDVVFKYSDTNVGSIEGNLFEGTSYDTTCEADVNYVLNASTSTAEKPMFSNYTGTTLGAFKAYLPKSAVGGATGAIQFRFDDATAISTVEMESSDDVLYNMAGQRVSSDYRGIVIKNGKKMWNN